MENKDMGASPTGTGLSPTVEPASGLDGSATSIPSAVHHEDAPGTLYIMFTRVEGCLHIRKWSVGRPFEGATLFANIGNGAPPHPLDSSEHYPTEMLPNALRFVAEHLWLQCEPHVIQDCVRIVLDAAQAIEARRAETGTGSVHESAVAESDAPEGGQP